MIALGSDHGGLALKEALKQLLTERGLAAEDCGTLNSDSVDYPDFGIKVANKVSSGEADLGILVCGTGIGMSIVANKFPRVRAALVTDSFMARMAKEHNNANILVLGGRVINESQAREIVAAWLDATFEGGRHQWRLDKIAALEQDGLFGGHGGGIPLKAIQDFGGCGQGAALPGEVIADVHGDADHPGLEAPARSEGVQGPEHAQVGLLGSILGQVPIAEHPPGQGQDPPFGARQQVPEGFHVASPDAAYQRLQRIVRRGFRKRGQPLLHQRGLSSMEHDTNPPSPIHTGMEGNVLTRNRGERFPFVRPRPWPAGCRRRRRGTGPRGPRGPATRPGRLRPGGW